MPKNTWVPKPPLDKLPLAVRKDLRDDYDTFKVQWESEVSQLLKAPFKINFNPNEVWAYASEYSSQPAGAVMRRYTAGFVDALKKYLEKYQETGRETFVLLVNRCEVTLNANALGDEAPVISADIRDGSFRILFKHNSLGYQTDYLYDSLVNAVEKAPRPKGSMSLIAKNSIKTDWTEKVGNLLAEIGKVLNMPDVVLDPNFEDNYALIDKDKGENNFWHDRFGYKTFDYFSDLKKQLEEQGFAGDDMLQEGLADVVTTKTFKLRVVDSLSGRDMNETLIENGVVIIQTTPKNWGYMTTEAGKGLVNLL